MSKDWVEKAAEEVSYMVGEIQVADHDSEAGFKWERKIRPKVVANIILSHAPVIDAEKLAKRLDDKYILKNRLAYQNAWPTDYTDRIKQVVQLITDSIDLKLNWVDGEARWGDFFLLIINALDGRKSVYDYRLYLKNKEIQRGREAKPELAQQACESALKRIVCGVKNVD